MELERGGAKTDQMEVEGMKRSKSSNRLRYDAEVQYLKKQNGSLEEVRRKLGLSRRKICQLLLVDPSAWTRWSAPGGEAPPHIYRALDWYLSIMEKDPEYRRLTQRFSNWLNQEKDYEARLADLESRLKGESSIGKRWKENGVPLVLAFLAGILICYFSLGVH